MSIVLQHAACHTPNSEATVRAPDQPGAAFRFHSRKNASTSAKKSACPMTTLDRGLFRAGSFVPGRVPVAASSPTSIVPRP